MKRKNNAMKKGWKMTNEKDKIIKDLKAEDRRLCMIISNLHTEIGNYNEKIEKQEQVIKTQQDIINNLIELIKVMQSY
jgi:adenosyl cobinamide kinase/adenosyl cobinamide phosphate guanylyltransferase